MACTDDSCDEVGDTCVNTANDANCDNGLFCDGAETCDATTRRCSSSGNPCEVGAGETCNEQTDSCEPPKPPSDWALAFDGTDDFVAVPHHPVLSLGTFTIEAWLRVDGLVDDQQGILSKGHFFGNYTVYVSQVNPGELAYVHQTKGGNWSMRWFGGAPVGQWTHIAIAVGPLEVTSFINGTPTATFNHIPPALNGYDLTIGAYFYYPPGHPNWPLNRFLFGAIDDLRIWNYARTAEEIRESMRTPSLDPTTPGLAASWDFNEGAGQLVNDRTGTVSPGLLGGTASVDSADPAWIHSDVPR